VPVVVSFHGADASLDARKPERVAGLLEVFRYAKRIFARSEALLGNLEQLGCPVEKLRLQRTGIPLDEWAFVDRQPPADGAWVLLQACRLVEKKGLLATLEAFRLIQAVFPLARLILVGDGPILALLQEKAAALGLVGQVDFPGFLSQGQLRPISAAAHLFFHPSQTAADGNREGVPNAMLEAMACGLPILATQHGGIPEAVTHGSSGFLVEERDAEGLARHALELMRSPERYLAMSRAAREEVETKFERNRVSAALEAEYELVHEACSSGHKP
jgi:colanic acid/amylovoran biosynthesis glycosyltransferase